MVFLAFLLIDRYRPLGRISHTEEQLERIRTEFSILGKNRPQRDRLQWTGLPSACFRHPGLAFGSFPFFSFG